MWEKLLIALQVLSAAVLLGVELRGGGRSLDGGGRRRPLRGGGKKRGGGGGGGGGGDPVVAAEDAVVAEDAVKKINQINQIIDECWEYHLAKRTGALSQ